MFVADSRRTIPCEVNIVLTGSFLGPPSNTGLPVVAANNSGWQATLQLTFGQNCGDCTDQLLPVRAVKVAGAISVEDAATRSLVDATSIFRLENGETKVLEVFASTNPSKNVIVTPRVEDDELIEFTPSYVVLRPGSTKKTIAMKSKGKAGGSIINFYVDSQDVTYDGITLGPIKVSRIPILTRTRSQPRFMECVPTVLIHTLGAGGRHCCNLPEQYLHQRPERGEQGDCSVC